MSGAVLIVDDDAAIRTVVAAALKREGHRVTTAASIAEHLFEPFVSGKPEGKGLGLPLVEKLVRDMGGIVQYARERDPEVTVFRILLQRAS